MAFRELVVEAIKKSTVMANSIIRRMNVAEWKNISRMTEMDTDYISDLASFHMPTFDDLKDDEKQEVIEKVWNKLKSGEKPEEVVEANPEQTPLSQSELKQKIMDYVKQNGAVLYPLEQAAEQLAQELSNIQESEDEKCPCCGKSPCECEPDCKCKSKEKCPRCGESPCRCSIKNLENLVKSYDEKESTITEAVMNDIPHEIDDQIHTLKDMRFELEQTKKNWNIAGVETQPMDQVLKDIDGLIASLYQNGAKMADDEISKGSSETEKETEKEEE